MTYHRGERAVQARAGESDRADHSVRAIRDRIPPAAAAFLAAQPLLVVGAADAGGDRWASLLTGAPGFARAVDDRTIEVAAVPADGDPLRPVLAAPAGVGMIAIDPATRRRMRCNGAAVPIPGGFRLTTDQVYANCPKYIQQRDHRAPAPAPGPLTATRGIALTAEQQAAVRAADTLFVATGADDGSADASHRGGEPGFVQVLSPAALRWPDYAGNAMYMTLGNLALDPAAGLLVPGWDDGTTLQLTGTARVDWDPAAAAAVPGALRMVEFAVTGVVELRGASPLRWGPPRSSPANPPAVSPRGTGSTPR